MRSIEVKNAKSTGASVFETLFEMPKPGTETPFQTPFNTVFDNYALNFSSAIVRSPGSTFGVGTADDTSKTQMQHAKP